MKDICARYGIPLRAAALQFPRRHPAVASVLVGTRSAAEVRDAAEMLRLGIPEELWDELAALGED